MDLPLLSEPQFGSQTNLTFCGPVFLLTVDEVSNMPACPREPCDEDDTFVVKYDGARKIITKEETPFSVIYNLQKERNKGTYYPFSCQKWSLLSSYMKAACHRRPLINL